MNKFQKNFFINLLSIIIIIILLDLIFNFSKMFKKQTNQENFQQNCIKDETNEKCDDFWKPDKLIQGIVHSQTGKVIKVISMDSSGRTFKVRVPIKNNRSNLTWGKKKDLPF